MHAAFGEAGAHPGLRRCPAPRWPSATTTHAGRRGGVRRASRATAWPSPRGAGGRSRARPTGGTGEVRVGQMWASGTGMGGVGQAGRTKGRPRTRPGPSPSPTTRASTPPPPAAARPSKNGLVPDGPARALFAPSVFILQGQRPCRARREMGDIRRRTKPPHPRRLALGLVPAVWRPVRRPTTGDALHAR